MPSGATIKILVENREDLKKLTGAEAVAKKIVPGGFVEVLCSDLDPVEMHYHLDGSNFSAKFNVRVRLQKVNSQGKKYLGFEKPVLHHNRSKVQQKKLNSKVLKRAVTHSAHVEFGSSQWWSDSNFFKIDLNLPKRKRLKVDKVDSI